ncbi:glycosyltransferase [Butyrivibrio sp. INlla16]|uniref:glycosyltransferase n=1 Tax=Butyrivibrio sp. INlla16 TaxID=1520807 RepID=UPI0008920F26|nr:glycosyltransferase [Butyrivibrio sp. INlla16]SDB36371.1 Glycosyl transferase family 2 [Butyrivibrio sp. INlla16]
MINVLMCTYNGEKYIGQQLDSIMAQTYRDFRLYIRDDGSTDATMRIVNEYAERFPEKVKVVSGASHLGYPDCFWDVLEKCESADYYAFSDQDDVWDEHKLEYAAEKMGDAGLVASDGGAGDGRPLLYIHDYDNCDGELGLISRHCLGDVAVLDEMNILFYTYASGFCMVINNALRDLLLRQNLVGKAMYHDELCIWTAYFHGKILYDDRNLTKYRRHEATYTEYGNGVGTLISNWLRREIFGDEFLLKCRLIRTFLSLKEIRPSEKRVCRSWLLLSGGRMNFARYFKRLCWGHRLRPSAGGEVALRIMFLMGRGAVGK